MDREDLDKINAVRNAAPAERQRVEVVYADGVEYLSLPTEEEIDAMREFTDHMFSKYFGDML